MSVLDCLFDSLNTILKKEFEKKTLLEHLDMVRKNMILFLKKKEQLPKH